MAVAAAAIAVAVVSLCLWARHFAGYHHCTIPGIYLALVAVAAIRHHGQRRPGRPRRAGGAIAGPQVAPIRP